MCMLTIPAATTCVPLNSETSDCGRRRDARVVIIALCSLLTPRRFARCPPDACSRALTNTRHRRQQIRPQNSDCVSFPCSCRRHSMLDSILAGFYQDSSGTSIRNVYRDQEERVWWFAAEKNDTLLALSEPRPQFRGTPCCSRQLKSVIS